MKEEQIQIRQSTKKKETILSMNIETVSTQNTHSKLHVLFGSIMRLFLLLCTSVCVMLSFIYSTGQLYKLSLTNFWCKEQYTLNEIHQHNREIGSQQGSTTSCYHIGSGSSVDQNALQSNSLNIYNSTLHITNQSIIFCILYAICGLLFMIVFLYHLIKLVIDFCNPDSNNKNKNKNAQTNKNKTNNSKCDNIKNWWSKCHCAMDESGWILRKYLLEIAEIMLQFAVLLQYGGNAIYSNDVSLAEYPQIVINFAIVLGSNCIVDGILWISYAIFPDTCYGILFAEILRVCDMIFDALYVIYPLIIAGEISFDTIGIYRIDNTLRFLASFFPQLLLCFSLHRSLVDLTEWTNKKDENKRYNKLQSNIGKPHDEEGDNDTHALANTNCNKSIRTCCVHVFNGLLFVITGISIISLVNYDINRSIEYCTHTDHNVAGEYPELAFYNDLCQYKVYHLFSSSQHYSCQCRLLTLSEKQSNCESVRIILSNHGSNTSCFGDILTNILHLWNMLQVVMLKNCINYGDVLSFEQKETFSSQYMQAFGIYGFQINKIDGNISSWQNSLEFLELSDTDLYYEDINWNGISKLINLKYFSMYLNHIDIWPESICNMKDLLFLQLAGSNKLSYMDECIGNLHHLQNIYFSWTGLHSIPASLWQLQNIQEIQLAFAANITIQSSNILTMKQIPPKLKKLYFQGTQLCEQFENIDLNNESHIACILLSDLNSCHHVCTKGSIYEQICLPWSYGDGHCNAVCNVEECNYDNGDCNQLCDFNTCDINLWDNGQCDQGCNSEACGWDQQDCINITDSNTFCNNDCDSKWLNDNFCDDNCMQSNCKNMEESDCKQCIEETPCYLWSIYFGTIDKNNNGFLEQYEVCDSWNLLKDLISVKNCNQSTNPKYDLNYDGKLNAYEALQVAVNSPIYVMMNTTKAKQLNCSVCMQHPELYNA